MANETFSEFYQENSKLLSEYLDTRMQLIRLMAIRTISRTFSMFIVVCLVSFMVLFFLLFLVISFSWLMADVTGSAALGFLCGAGVFLLILLLGIIFRKPLFLNPLIRLFIHTSTQEEDEDDQY
ncbi:MAG: hypothetical protein RLZZ557_979 [Bacteroidota bacterium]|jgi:uncharacterized membrane protein (DUF485 family)